VTELRIRNSPSGADHWRPLFGRDCEASTGTSHPALRRGRTSYRRFLFVRPQTSEL